MSGSDKNKESRNKEKSNTKSKACRGQQNRDHDNGGPSNTEDGHGYDICRHREETFATAREIGIDCRNFQTARATVNHASSLGSTWKHLLNGVTMGEALEMRDAVQEAAGAIRSDALPPLKDRENMPPPPPRTSQSQSDAKCKSKGKGKVKGKGAARIPEPSGKDKVKRPARTPEPVVNVKGEGEGPALTPEPDEKGKGGREGKRKGKGKGNGPAVTPELDGKKKRKGKLEGGRGESTANATSKEGVGSVSGDSRPPDASLERRGARGGARVHATRHATRSGPATTFFGDSAHEEGAQNLLRFTSYAGMIAHATEHLGTTGGPSMRSVGNGSGAAGAASAQPSPGSPGKPSEASESRSDRHLDVDTKKLKTVGLSSPVTSTPTTAPLRTPLSPPTPPLPPAQFSPPSTTTSTKRPRRTRNTNYSATRNGLPRALAPLAHGGNTRDVKLEEAAASAPSAAPAAPTGGAATATATPPRASVGEGELLLEFSRRASFIPRVTLDATDPATHSAAAADLPACPSARSLTAYFERAGILGSEFRPCFSATTACDADASIAASTAAATAAAATAAASATAASVTRASTEIIPSVRWETPLEALDFPSPSPIPVSPVPSAASAESDGAVVDVVTVDAIPGAAVPDALVPGPAVPDNAVEGNAVPSAAVAGSSSSHAHTGATGPLPGSAGVAADTGHRSAEGKGKAPDETDASYASYGNWVSMGTGASAFASAFAGGIAAATAAGRTSSDIPSGVDRQERFPAGSMFGGLGSSSSSSPSVYRLGRLAGIGERGSASGSSAGSSNSSRTYRLGRFASSCEGGSMSGASGGATDIAAAAAAADAAAAAAAARAAAAGAAAGAGASPTAAASARAEGAAAEGSRRSKKRRRDIEEEDVVEVGGAGEDPRPMQAHASQVSVSELLWATQRAEEMDEEDDEQEQESPKKADGGGKRRKTA